MPRALVCLLAALLASAAGAASGPTTPQAHLQPAALGSSSVDSSYWIDVPYVAQSRDGCGAASISMVMQYWQPRPDRSAAADPARIMHVLDPAANHGIPATAMLRYFQQNGYRAVAFSAGLPDLEQQLQQGRPLIAALSGGAARELHFVVVVGLDVPHSLVLVNDPAQRKLLKEDRSQFERAWKASGYWTLLAVPAAAGTLTNSPATPAPLSPAIP